MQKLFKVLALAAILPLYACSGGMHSAFAQDSGAGKTDKEPPPLNHVQPDEGGTNPMISGPFYMPCSTSQRVNSAVRMSNGQLAFRIIDMDDGTTIVGILYPGGAIVVQRYTKDGKFSCLMGSSTHMELSPKLLGIPFKGDKPEAAPAPEVSPQKEKKPYGTIVPDKKKEIDI